MSFFHSLKDFFSKRIGTNPENTINISDRLVEMIISKLNSIEGGKHSGIDLAATSKVSSSSTLPQLSYFDSKSAAIILAVFYVILLFIFLYSFPRAKPVTGINKKPKEEITNNEERPASFTTTLLPRDETPTKDNEKSTFTFKSVQKVPIDAAKERNIDIDSDVFIKALYNSGFSVYRWKNGIQKIKILRLNSRGDLQILSDKTIRLSPMKPYLDEIRMSMITSIFETERESLSSQKPPHFIIESKTNVLNLSAAGTTDFHQLVHGLKDMLTNYIEDRNYILDAIKTQPLSKKL